MFGNYDSISGNAWEANRGANDGKLIVRFPGQPVDGTYWVLGTDYNNYSVVWSCTQTGPVNLRKYTKILLTSPISFSTFIEFAWILSRTPGLNTASQKAVNDILSKNNIKTSPFRDTKQDNATCGGNGNFHILRAIQSILSLTRNLIPHLQ